ncbi:MAG: RNA-binding protein [Flavobacterium sp. BFFFF2]|nr:MAG: RNA-binding protein [Flavobacterium sp. BFFFF2]
MKKITLIVFLQLGFLSINAQSTCTNALPVTEGIYTVTAVAGTNLTTTCSSGTFANWYSYTPTADKWVTVTSDLSQNICKDTHVNIYIGSCTALACYASDDDAGIIACNSGNTYSYLSVVSFMAYAGTTYLIEWDNKWSATGFDFQLIESAPPPAPPVNFVATTISTTSAICLAADVTGDYLDDVVTVETNQMTIQKQVPGGFQPIVIPLPALTATPGWSIAAGDIDKNGFNDMVFGGGSRLTIIKANQDGSSFTEVPYPQNIFTQRTNFIDINNDGNLDLWACHDVAQSHAYRNDGSGNLIFDISLMPTLAVGGNYQSTWTDIDNDGDQDMYLAKCRGAAPVGDPMRINLLYKNNGDGTFTESGAAAGVNDGAQSWSTAIEDYDNDGDLDILMSNISDTNKMFLNNGDGTFTDIFATTGIAAQVGSWELQAADFNNDGWMDFFWQNSKELYINNGNMTFTGYDLPFSEGAIGDLNNDGFLDVQFNNKVYFNTPNQNNWLTVTLQGTQSNRNGIGARVEIYGTWGKQIREIRSGSGFSHQSSLNAHFGIGVATEITKMIIKWPSGAVDTLLNPAINQPIHVVESSTLSTDQFQLLTGISIFPNPVKDSLEIRLKAEKSVSSVQIYDITGRVVLTFSKSTTLDVQTLKTGTYVISVKDMDGNEFKQKFIKN